MLKLIYLTCNCAISLTCYYSKIINSSSVRASSA